MLQLFVDLVRETIGPIDGGTATAGAGGVAGLDHEIGDHAMNGARGVVRLSDEGEKVAASQWGMSSVKLEGEGTLGWSVSLYFVQIWCGGG